ncbi:MAG: HEAT repeat domain-containing protein [Methanothrix sp.]|nr:HEAT repeat domain-containing protein [Methanothrix sp.]
MRLNMILAALVVLAALAMPAAADRVDDLIWDMLYDANPETRAEAAVSLGRISDDRVFDPLVEASYDENVLVRAAVAQAFGRIGDTRAVPHLIRMADDYSLVNLQPVVHKQAVYALGVIGDPRAVNTLTRIYDEGHSKDVAWALGKIGDPRAVDPLIGGLSDKDYFVRQSAATALGEIGDPRAIGPLTKALDDHWVRDSATEALRKINESVANPPPRNEDVQVVTDKTLDKIDTTEPQTLPEETPISTEESPLPAAIGAMSIMATVLFMKYRRNL